MITGAKTIAQYKILEWVEENFIPGSVIVEFTDTNRAIIKDTNEDTMKVMYIDKKGVVEE